MKTKMIWADLSVGDLQETTRFYTEMGFKKAGHDMDDGVCFFFGEHNFVINFFTKERFRFALKGEIADSRKTNEVTFSISAENKKEVDQWAEAAKKAGGTVHAAPQDFEAGYICGFSDPDGHKFNVVYWPGMM